LTRLTGAPSRRTRKRRKYTSSKRARSASARISGASSGTRIRWVCPTNCMSTDKTSRSAVTSMRSLPIRRRPSATCSAKTAATAPMSSASSGRLSVCTKSWRRSATTQPSALVRPGRAGTSTRGAPSSRAMAVAWSGPAPPKANSAKSRGSSPSETETIRVAPAMAVLAISITAAAAVSASTPSGAPSFSAKIARMASTEAAPSTASSRSGFSRPSRRLASEIVGSVPPRP
jgi:hypothetical protein